MAITRIGNHQQFKGLKVSGQDVLLRNLVKYLRLTLDTRMLYGPTGAWMEERVY